MHEKTLAGLFFFIVSVLNPSPSFSHHLRHFGLPHGTEITISQTIPTIQSPPPIAEKDVYIQPRWMESKEGVLVLQPGHWTESEIVQSPLRIAKNKVYVEPRWVETTGGVLLLQPGYWTETEPVRNNK